MTKYFYILVIALVGFNNQAQSSGLSKRSIVTTSQKAYAKSIMDQTKISHLYKSSSECSIDLERKTQDFYAIDVNYDELRVVQNGWINSDVCNIQLNYVDSRIATFSNDVLYVQNGNSEALITLGRLGVTQVTCINATYINVNKGSADHPKYESRLKSQKTVTCKLEDAKSTKLQVNEYKP